MLFSGLVEYHVTVDPENNYIGFYGRKYCHSVRAKLVGSAMRIQKIFSAVRAIEDSDVVGRLRESEGTERYSIFQDCRENPTTYVHAMYRRKSLQSLSLLKVVSVLHVQDNGAEVDRERM